MIIWATIGPSTQIVAACLPTLGPLLQHRQSSTQLVETENVYGSKSTELTVRGF